MLQLATSFAGCNMLGPKTVDRKGLKGAMSYNENNVFKQGPKILRKKKKNDRYYFPASWRIYSIRIHVCFCFTQVYHPKNQPKL